MKLKALMVLGLLILGSPAWAIPIHYFEELDGDLAGSSEDGPLTRLRLGVGDNTIGGYWGNGCFGQCVDFDSFRFIVPRNTVLDRIALQFIPLDQTQAAWMTCFRIGDMFQEVFRDVSAPLFSATATTMFDAILPLRSGRYQLDQAYFSGNLGTMDALYVWTMHATRVPEPGTLTLMVGGMVALMWLRRRRHA
jgi:hypothetical protein